ncbi:hypothetical protein J7443_03570 [Tropicibacter sp. R15_0]|uniref:hypothetical protein n=1 Tax=Tropicibacter sp. R15_0 TaxID=2821101 RepID=UPI001ADD35A8|nr:hypothetical protein [Tropicibacter sp. R15_0]MBO9464297.1 hypothetical protein [Tropicibacter sp. R15_0]
MSPLALLLTVKILLTLPLIGLFGFATNARLNNLTGQWGQDPLIYRLYAVALSALLVGYLGALFAVLDLQVPWGMLWVGLVSNAGAALMIVTWSCHPRLRRSAWAFGTIAAGLVIALIFPAQAISPVFG